MCLRNYQQNLFLSQYLEIGVPHASPPLPYFFIFSLHLFETYRSHFAPRIMLDCYSLKSLTLDIACSVKNATKLNHYPNHGLRNTSIVIYCTGRMR